MKKFFTALFLAAATAFAASQPQTHDGFFLNLALGLGFQSFDYNYTGEYYNGYGLEASGLASEFDVKLGGRIVNNLLLHATLVGVANAGDLKVTDDDGESLGSTSDRQVSLSIVGIGLTYYLPQNIFVTASIGSDQFNMNDSSSDSGSTKAVGSSDNGFAFQVGAGKEWWVSDNWGLGVSASFIYGFADDGNVGDMSAYSINIMFSATYN